MSDSNNADEEAWILSQIPKQRPSMAPAKSLSTILNRLIQQKGYANEQSNNLMHEAWAEIVGPTLAKQSSPGKISRGALLVEANNHMVRTELEFQKLPILRELQRRFPEFNIRSLKILDARRG